MTRFTVDLDSPCPPERAISALIDFTDRRPDIWPGLARQFYQVYSLGETSADVQEGSMKPMKVWAKEHYDWSRPGIVTWTVRESNFCTPGSGVSVAVTPQPAGGSHVHLVWERYPSNARGRFVMVFMKLFGPRIIGSYMRKVLNALAEQPTTA